MEFSITKTWDGQDIQHDPVVIHLELSEKSDSLLMKVKAPFFNDPPNPGGVRGQPFHGLWEYEVVEIFFSNEDNQYVEIEICPWGQHIVLLLDGVRRCIHHSLPLDYEAQISGSLWSGRVTIPLDFLPRNASKMNAYAIHGSGSQRTYESLHPVPQNQFQNPDFHRLEYFRPIDLTQLTSADLSSWSKVWQEYLTKDVH